MTADPGLPVGLDLTADLVADLANDRALARANDLAHNLADASYCARDLVKTSTSTLELAQAGASYRDRANDRARALTNYFNLDLDHALVNYRDRANELDRDLASFRDRARARALVRALDRVLERDLGRCNSGHLEFVRHLGDDLAHAGRLARDIGRDSAFIGDLDLKPHGHSPASDSDHDPELTAKAPVKAGNGHLARTPVRLAGVAARLLPEGSRARYTEEYQGELAELAAAGAGRRNQFGYALRLLTRAPLLRVELRTPSRRRMMP